MGLNLLYRDERFVAVDKPPGALVVPGRGPLAAEPSLARELSAQCGFERLWIVHRLDRETTGVVLFALGAAAHRAASLAFAAGRVHKRYLALVAGLPEPAAASIAAPLAPDPRRRHRGGMVVDPQRGKPALTEYRVLAELCAGRAALVEARPRTGRTHQIRVHLAHRGHPLLQDARYGQLEPHWPFRALLLHAAELEVPELALQVRAPLPAAFVEALRALGGASAAVVSG